MAGNEWKKQGPEGGPARAPSRQARWKKRLVAGSNRESAGRGAAATTHALHAHGAPGNLTGGNCGRCCDGIHEVGSHTTGAWTDLAPHPPEVKRKFPEFSQNAKKRQVQRRARRRAIGVEVSGTKWACGVHAPVPIHNTAPAGLSSATPRAPATTPPNKLKSRCDHSASEVWKRDAPLDWSPSSIITVRGVGRRCGRSRTGGRRDRSRFRCTAGWRDGGRASASSR